MNHMANSNGLCAKSWKSRKTTDEMRTISIVPQRGISDIIFIFLLLKSSIVGDYYHPAGCVVLCSR